MIDLGLEPGFGSDLTGMVKETEDPFFHIWCAVTRTTPQGPFVPEQAITVTEALRMLTIWAARAQGEDALKGSLEVGKLADTIALSEDIMRVPPARLRELSVLQTIVGGRTVWQRTLL